MILRDKLETAIKLKSILFAQRLKTSYNRSGNESDEVKEVLMLNMAGQEYKFEYSSLHYAKMDLERIRDYLEGE